MIGLFRTLAVLALLAPAMPARAQTAPADAPPYEAQLLRLSEVLGALHYLRTLCNAPEGGQWRQQMQSLIDAEATTPERRERLVASFNLGYRGFERAYQTCTPSADIAIRRYLDEGTKLAREITSRYGN